MKFSRRKFIQTTALASTVVALGPNHTSAVATETTEAEGRSSIGAGGWSPRELKRKPNIVMVILDDVGFGDLGCYGAEHKTPCMDQIAADGTRFNNFHVTALCAPTRACLLTGRNAHAVGVGNIAEWGRDHPSYKGWIREDAATLAEILRPEGYSTLATGKWHLTPLGDQNGTGPFDHWPVQRGFDRWYGFHSSAADHWHPEMFENTSAAYPEKTDDYHLSADLSDRSIAYVRDHIAANPDNPFFLHLAFGACHFPLHAPVDYIERYLGKYQRGWDAIRQERFEKQLKMGLVPKGSRMAPRNADVPPWEELSGDQQRIVARQQEVYAAFLEHTDAQIQRLVDFLKAEEQYNDTIFVVLSDNGASFGGPIEGRFDVRRVAYQKEKESIKELIESLDLQGTDQSFMGYSRGWAQVSNTPLKWYKADTYEGGIRTPLIMSWPNGKLPEGHIAEQYHHAIDLVPTLMDMINKPFPKEIEGEKILPIQGSSFAYAFDKPKATTRKTVQYFETMGDRAIWQKGWKAVTRHQFGVPFEEDTWELYHAAKDFAELNNLAKAEPERLQSLIALWFSEARRYGVLPMDDDRHKLHENSVPRRRSHYVFYPKITRLDRLSVPDIYSVDSRFRADVELSSNKAEGVIFAVGDSAAGYEWYMQDGYLVCTYVYIRNRKYKIKSTKRIPKGKHALGLEFHKTGKHSAKVTFSLDGETIASKEFPKMWPIYVLNSGLRCGENPHSPISREYKGSFPFTQQINRVEVEIDLKKEVKV